MECIHIHISIDVDSVIYYLSYVFHYLYSWIRHVRCLFILLVHAYPESLTKCLSYWCATQYTVYIAGSKHETQSTHYIHNTHITHSTHTTYISHTAHTVRTLHITNLIINVQKAQCVGYTGHLVLTIHMTCVGSGVVFHGNVYIYVVYSRFTKASYLLLMTY